MILHKVIEEVKKELPGFEVRDEQLQMQEAVFQAMNDGLHAGIHAPTGTGKTFGYLFPYIAQKISDPSYKMAISTYTITLQSQIERDIDFVNKIYQKMTGKPPLTYVVLKGKSNYFCQHRFDLAKEGEMFSEKTFERVQKALDSALKADTPLDRQNMDVKLGDDTWEEFQVESCKKEKCPFFHQCTYAKDYFLKKFDLYIVNHSLYFFRHFFVQEAWDMVNFVAFDESHKIEKVLLEAKTFPLSLKTLEKWVFQGYNMGKKFEIEEHTKEWIKTYFYQHPTVERFKKLLSDLSDIMYERERKTQRKEETMVFLDSGIDYWETIDLIRDVILWQREMFQSFEAFLNEKQKASPEWKEEKTSWVASLLELKEFCSLLMAEDDIGLLWVERIGKKDVLLKVTPNDIDHIPTPFTKPLLFTSGTLAQDGSVRPFATRLNVELDIDMALPTPFSLSEQTLAYASKTVLPTSRSYESQLESEIWELLLRGNMKTFVLFTSTTTMENLHKKLLPKLTKFEGDRPVEVWLQEKTNHSEIMASFKNPDVSSVLFGTLTYFEGVDLKEESLTQIILTRLPYSVPNHPIQLILDKKQGFSKWEALIRYEQAFGRLIRTKRDYGTFSILDNRIFNNYSTPFRESLEHDGIRITDSMDEIESFYQSRK